jgi:hypothetical protein
MITKARSKPARIHRSRISGANDDRFQGGHARRTVPKIGRVQLEPVLLHRGKLVEREARCVDDERPLAQVDARSLGRLEGDHKEHKEDEEVEVLEHRPDARDFESVVVQQRCEVWVVNRDRFAFVVLGGSNRVQAVSQRWLEDRKTCEQTHVGDDGMRVTGRLVHDSAGPNTLNDLLARWRLDEPLALAPDCHLERKKRRSDSGSAPTLK